MPACNCDSGNGEPIEGRLTARPDVLSLGTVPVGLAGRTSLVLANAGLSTLRITEAAPSENLAGEVRLDAVPAAILPNGMNEAGVIFTPTSKGPREGELIFATDSRLTPMVHVELVGLATAPRLETRPARVDFGRVLIGGSATATVAVTNQGDSSITINTVTNDVDTSAEFMSGLGAIRTVAPGESFELLVRYAPVDPGFDEGRIVVGDDTPLPVRAGIAVRGEGVISEIEIEPTQLSFSGLFIGETRARGFDIRNLGTHARAITALALTGTIAGELSIVSSTATAVPFTLQPGEERRVFVQYAPVDAIADADRVRIESDGLAEPAFVELIASASGRPAPRLAISPMRIDFGVTQVGSTSMRSFELDNIGSADLRLARALDIDPPSAVFNLEGAPAADAAFAPLDSHTLSVVFTPSALGPAPAAELVIESDDPQAPVVRVPIAGEGVAGAVADLQISPAIFGRVPRGTVARRAVTLRNLGSGPLAIGAVTLADDAGGRYTIESQPMLPLALAPGAQAVVALAYGDPLGLEATRLGTLRITSDDPHGPLVDLALSAETVPPPFGAPSLEVELAWDTAGTDLDLHLVRMGGADFDRPSDCCFCNPNPDWGAAGFTPDDPFLDADDTDGFGPETIALQNPNAGDYAIVVHDKSDRASGLTTATVTVRSGGNVLATVAHALGGGDRWDAGVFNWSGRGSFFASGAAATPSALGSCF